MTWRDKLEIGLKDDAPFRRDNLPESQADGTEIPVDEKRSAIVAEAIVRSRKHPQAKRAIRRPASTRARKTRRATAK